MDEVEAGRTVFLKLLGELDATAEAVIPTAATNDHFLIALTNPKGRTLISVNEDDFIDLAEDDEIVDEVREALKEALANIGG